MTVLPPTRLNAYQQPVGPALPDWQPRARLQARPCRPQLPAGALDAARHAAQLHAAFATAPDGRDWTYMMSGPFPDAASYRHQAEQMQATRTRCTMQ
jgi:hypothetical protein